MGRKTKTNLYWIGPRLSDLADIESSFDGAVVIMGQEAGDLEVYSLEAQTRIRLNHNDDDNYFKVAAFVNRSLAKIISQAGPDVRFMWYSRFPDSASAAIIQRSPFNNSTALTNLLSNKLQCRLLLAGEGVHTLPTANISPLWRKSRCTYKNLVEMMPGHHCFVVQTISGAGGFTTYLVESAEDETKLNQVDDFSCLVSPLIPNAWPINVHILVEKDRALSLAPSIQVIDSSRGKMEYAGADYALAQTLPKSVLEKIAQTSKKIGQIIGELGYRGVAGIDYLWDGAEHLIFVEINARFQGSSAALNQALRKEGFDSLQEAQRKCFTGERIAQDIEKVDCSYAFFSPSMDDTDFDCFSSFKGTLNSPDPRISDFNKTRLAIRVYSDGSEALNGFEPGATAGRIGFDRQICNKSVKGDVQLVPAVRLLALKKPFGELSLDQNASLDDKARLKFALLAHGSRLSQRAVDRLMLGQEALTIRDGIAGGLQICMFDQVYVNVPIKDFDALISPFMIDYNGTDFTLAYRKEVLGAIKLIPLPQFTGKKTSQGTPMERVGQAFTDRLGIAPYGGCRFNGKSACSYCEIGHIGEAEPNDLKDILELIDFCKQQESRIKHLLISGGTPNPSQWSEYVAMVQQIRQAYPDRIYLMTTPPKDLELLKDLKEAGVDEIGLNLEVYDEQWAKQRMPGKGKIDREHYIEALKQAKELWDEPQAVRSILIAGLEPLDSTLKGVEELCKLEVMPILSPFTPVSGTAAALEMPMSADELFDCWKKAQNICTTYNMPLGPTCPACQNNTLSMPLTE